MLKVIVNIKMTRIANLYLDLNYWIFSMLLSKIKYRRISLLDGNTRLVLDPWNLRANYESVEISYENREYQ